MIETYKIIRGIYDPEVCQGLLSEGRSSATRGHQFKLFKERARLNLRKNSFSFRVVDLWNSLPSFVVEAPSIEAFERRLDKVWNSFPIRFDFEASTTPPRHANTKDLAPEAF